MAVFRVAFRSRRRRGPGRSRPANDRCAERTYDAAVEVVGHEDREVHTAMPDDHPDEQVHRLLPCLRRLFCRAARCCFLRSARSARSASRSGSGDVPDRRRSPAPRPRRDAVACPVANRLGIEHRLFAGGASGAAARSGPAPRARLARRTRAPRLALLRVGSVFRERRARSRAPAGCGGGGCAIAGLAFLPLGQHRARDEDRRVGARRDTDEQREGEVLQRLRRRRSAEHADREQRAELRGKRTGQHLAHRAVHDLREGRPRHARRVLTYPVEDDRRCRRARNQGWSERRDRRRRHLPVGERVHARRDQEVVEQRDQDRDRELRLEPERDVGR